MLTQEILKSQLHYNVETGIFTRLQSKCNSVKVGDAAGGLNGRGYLQISINHKSYLAHRLVWMYIYGAWPKEQIDHINGVRDDNRSVNLREATLLQNNMNRRIAKNKSGFRGVYANQGKWLASCRHNGKHTHLGRFITKEEASDAYEKFAKLSKGEFYCE